MKGRLYTDGGSRGNPGPSAIAYILYDGNGRKLEDFNLHIGEATNNIAEYEALLAGLRCAIRRGVTQLEVVCDSELVVKHMKREYQVKNYTLSLLYNVATDLETQFKTISYIHIPREENKEADRLVNICLDEHMTRPRVRV